MGSFGEAHRAIRVNLLVQYVRMSKLTLSVDPEIVSSAKRYARQHGTSVSRMVETYLGAVSKPVRTNGKDTPALNLLRGILEKADIEDYRRHLASKYR